MDLEFERVRDFLILHYVATTRDDSAFWNHVRTMPIPDSLAEKLDLFRKRGRTVRYDHGLFLPPSWIAVMLGQRILPEQYDARIEHIGEADIASYLSHIRTQITDTVAKMDSHADYLAANGMTSTAA